MPAVEVHTAVHTEEVQTAVHSATVHVPAMHAAMHVGGDAQANQGGSRQTPRRARMKSATPFTPVTFGVG